MRGAEQQYADDEDGKGEGLEKGGEADGGDSRWSRDVQLRTKKSDSDHVPASRWEDGVGQPRCVADSKDRPGGALVSGLQGDPKAHFVEREAAGLDDDRDDEPSQRGLLEVFDDLTEFRFSNQQPDDEC